jgi:hypothetical protein
MIAARLGASCGRSSTSVKVNNRQCVEAISGMARHRFAARFDFALSKSISVLSRGLRAICEVRSRRTLRSAWIIAIING